jgi:hypothetical protein
LALIGNYSVLNKQPGKTLGGSTVSDSRANYGKSGALRSSYFGDQSVVFEKKDAYPRGYVHPYSWVLPIRPGGMSSVNLVTGIGNVSGSGALGRNIDAGLAGFGTIDPSSAAQLVVSAVASLVGSGTLSASVIGKLEASAALSGSGNVTGALGALASAVATLVGTGAVSATPRAVGNVSASITPFTELSPESLAAAIWNALAADFDASGTMGEKLNASGSASDPWTSDLSGYNTDGTAGKKLKDLLTKIQFLSLK